MSETASVREREQQLSRARLKARILAPAVNAALAPVLLVVSITCFMSPDFLGSFEFSFRMWLYICLTFCPAIALGAVWHARLLTTGRPLHERALTGLSAVLGIVLSIAALASTLVVLALFAWVKFIIMFGLPVHVAFKFLLLFAVQALIFLLLLAPYFMVAGAILGLSTAAVVHATYNLDRAARVPIGQFAIAVAWCLSVILGIYAMAAQLPVLPQPESRSGTVHTVQSRTAAARHTLADGPASSVCLVRTGWQATRPAGAPVTGAQSRD
ncbi:MAG: hypothetical protein LC772_00790 [Chloroflexi bacterium]|nr:hypothetical protein [Chloroflexota bacterium]